MTIGAVVPGDIVTDFQRAGLYGDPLMGTNFKNAMYDESTWTYNRTFDLAPAVAGSTGSLYLVLDGVKMAAAVTLNGVPLGETADQFLRYTFDVTKLVRPTGNVLLVTFYSTHDPKNWEGRYMACSGPQD